MSEGLPGAGRVALVTGAARGIGAATVRRLTDDGYRVLALDACAGNDPDAPYPLPTRDDLDAVVADCPDGSARTLVVDVRDRAVMEAAVGEVVDEWGRLDAVVAGAALLRGGRPLWETPDADLDLLWEVDAKGVWNTVAVAVPLMLAGPDPSGCRVVTVASAAGSTGLFRLAAYSMVKHAVVGLTRGLAADLAGTGVTACVVSPGSTDTAMLDATAAVYGTTRDDLVSHQALGRVIAPEEIAATIALCCSREGAALNGSVVAADGGFRA